MVEIPHAKYFEGVLQLRNPNEELIGFVERTVREDDRAAITKIKKVRNGVDYYLTSQKYLQILGKKVRSRFSGEYKLTSTLHTERDGKRLYRVTVLFRQYPFSVGDRVEVGGEVCRVVRIEKNTVTVQEVRSHKKLRVPPEQVSVR